MARESLWPVVSREEKFKAKNIVDGAVFRGADFFNAFLFTGLSKFLAVQPYLAGLAAVLAAGWFGRRSAWVARVKSALRDGAKG